LKVFVAYGFNERDSWIPELVFPLVRAFGGEVVTGEDLQGQQITDAVRREIDQADALIGFRTLREGEAAGMSHRWVEDELAYARTAKVLEVREDGVSGQGGLLGDRQWIPYRPAERDRLLVELVKTLGRWMRENTVKLQLLPQEFVDEISDLLETPGLRCTYTVLERGRESEPRPAEIRPITGGLFIFADGLSADALMRVRVEGHGRRWRSVFQGIDSVSVHLTAD